MTDLLPHREWQPDKLYAPIEDLHWYSPAAVARMIEEARKEEREACIKALAMRCEFYALNTDDESENVVSECIHIIKGMGEK